MQRVVYYARVSTEDEQQTAALKIQCQENEEFISARKDWKLVDQYVDEAKTGTTTIGRTQFLRMLSDMSDDVYDIILIKQIDRGWRSLADWKLFESELVKNGKKLFIRLKNEFYDIEDDGKYISTTMDNMFAEWFSRNHSKKMNNAHKSRMKKGTIVTNGKMYGYRQVNADLVIDEDEAKIVKYIFNAYVQGRGLRTIMKELMEMGIRNRANNPLRESTIRRILQNEKYKGTLICGKQHMNFFTKEMEQTSEEDWYVHEDRIPPIVEPAVWDRANQVLASKRRQYDSPEEKRKVYGYYGGVYAYSGKIKCPLCNSTFYRNSSVKKKTTHTWMCSRYKTFGKKSPEGCVNRGINEEMLNSVLKKLIFNLWSEKDKTIAGLLEALNKNLADTPDTDEVEMLVKEKAKIETRKGKLIDLYSDELINKTEFKTRNEELEERMLAIQAKLKQATEYVQQTQDSIDRVNKIKEYLSTQVEAPEKVDDEFIKELVDEIIFYPEKRMDVIINGNQFLNLSFNKGYRDRGGVESGHTGVQKYPCVTAAEPKRMADKGDILMSVRAPVGDINIAFEPCCLGCGLAGIRSKSGCQSFILYSMFAMKYQMDLFNSQGTVFDSINKNDMANLTVLIPTDKIVRKFEEMVKPMDSAIEAKFAGNCYLKVIRDILLPRLISGKLQIDKVAP